ncbi:MAG: hypothetical protein GX024_01520 [Clostridiales bacterium]|nr:hypothetical protein [Clostridiales bacterium]
MIGIVFCACTVIVYTVTNEHCMKNIMEATLRRGLVPVNAAEDKAESLFERSEFDEGPGASFTDS